MQIYKVCKCIKCNRLQITTADKSYRCLKCFKLNKVIDAITLFKSYSGSIARDFKILYDRELIRLSGDNR